MVVFVPQGEQPDGQMSLSRGTVEVGDVVEVLAEGVGPGNAFHLCRVRNSGNGPEVEGWDEVNFDIGWYPIRYLESLR